MLDENIRFKGMCKDTGVWYEGYHVQDADGNDFIVEPNTGNPTIATLIISHHVLSDTVCTHYGDRDHAGNRIFTGDILQGFMYSAGNRTKSMGAKFVYQKDRTLSPITHAPWYYNTVPESNECTIIGNQND